jgi:hypothetical protein
VEFQSASGEAFSEVFELDVDDERELLLAQRVEDDHFVDTVEELRTELRLQEIFDRGFDFPVARLLVGQRLDAVGAEVARHDDDGVLEIHRSALAVVRRPSSST